MKSLLASFIVMQLAVALGLAAPSQKPNIIYILADDMGYSDIGCYGSEIATPNLDGLAKDGLRFTQFYNTARCCPTRASLLSGLYPHQAGIGHMMDDRGVDGYRGELNRRCVTIAEALKPAGYKTYAVGKWHVTRFANATTDAQKANWPLQRGFDRFYGTIHGAGSFFDPNTLTRDNQTISPYADPEYPGQDFYYTDAISDHAVRFVREHREKTPEQPFFLYVAYTAAHWPMHARESEIAKYAGRYDAGYQTIRDARYARMLHLGVIQRESTVNWPIPDDMKETKFWDWDKRNMEVFAAMVDNMDRGIGRLVAALKATGQFENTLLCYLQDNGGCQEEFGRKQVGKPRAAAPSLPALPAEYLQPDMVPKQTRDGYPMRQGKGVMAGGADTYIGYGYGWATVSNTPFRAFKHFTHEGGISTPLIVHWPQKIKVATEASAGFVHAPGHLIDLMATAVDVAGATYPKEFAGQPITPMEGRSLVSFFSPQSAPQTERPIFWEHEGNAAVRVGNFKLVREGRDGAWELYDIATDRSEQTDLAASQPEKVQELAQLWDAWSVRAMVVPYPSKSMPTGTKKIHRKAG